MAPSDLTGLNIIHPVQNNFDARDLLSYQPDLSAQLDLWTHLPFESEEVPHHKPTADDDEDEPRDRSLPTPAFDISSLLAGFGVDPYRQPQPSSTTAPPSGVVSPSLAQLLALHSLQSSAAGTVNPQTQIKAQIPDPPPTKRARTRKSSVSDDADETSSVTTTPVSASEDKRRRNTAASARFRLKKKEREAALETKAKDLEIRVNELERECEALRRENGWLKGLVVGVTQGNKRPREDE